MRKSPVAAHLGTALVLWSLCGSVSATQAEALKIIGDFADRICPPASTETSTSSTELSIAAKAELANLLKNLAAAGVSATAKYETASSRNVLQKDLAGLLKDIQACKLQVWNDLKQRFDIGDGPNSDCRISGRIVNGDDDAPIASARVLARSKTRAGDWQPVATSSKDGSYAGSCRGFSSDDFPLQLAITHSNWRCATFGSSFTEDGWQSIYPGGDKDVNLIVSIRKVSRLKMLACKV